MENEVGHALYPVTREDYVNERLRVSDKEAKNNNIDMEWRRNNQEQIWLNWLKLIKAEKDKNSSLWIKMKNWD